ncbi:hypothetical protein PWY87_16640 [Kribbella solani]|uniref:hypothetical protein n=1 Tax=Kribbella solani TaxID=236067 RepID=UPI0029BF0C7C|nr:hypothetical protein [Kribbella solani]MDX3003318.1 hypothetical protein [Kribbella solani]
MTTHGPYPQPTGGIKATLTGGNTVGATLREREPRADGYRHLDTPALIRRLLDLNANTYLYCIWDCATDYDDLVDEFMPAAAAAGIDVIPYIVPPTETSDYGRASRPYRLDYIAWAKAFAELAVKYPNFKAWAIDDFEVGNNASLFTPEYMREFLAAAAAISPELRFYTCAYFGMATNAEFLDKYGEFVDGIIYPFLDGPYENTTIADSLARSMDEILALTDPRGLELIPLIYTGRFLDAPLHATPEYCTATLTTTAEYVAAGKIPGVVSYGTQLDDGPAPTVENKAMYGNGRLALVNSRARAAAGSTASATQRVPVDPRLSRYEVSFWYHRWFLANGIEPGRYQLEMLIDDTVVWTMDLYEQRWPVWTNGDGMEGPVDVTKYVAGRNEVELTFRLHVLQETAGQMIDVGVDHVESIGLGVRNGGFEENSDWILRGSGPVFVVYDHYLRDRSARIFAAISRVYAGR